MWTNGIIKSVGVLIVASGGLIRSNMKSFEDMVNTVIEWYCNQPTNVQIQFQRCPFNELGEYHHTLGMKIRNEFKLWNEEWVPKLIDGVDYADDHPDAISMRVIEEVWKRTR